MNENIKSFRLKHGCADCTYYKKECKGISRCVFDFLPYDSADDDIELFLIS